MTMPKELETPHFSKLKPRHLNAIDCLVAGKSVAETADIVGVNRHTVSGWLNDNPIFIAALNEKRKEVWNVVHEQIRSMVPAAINVLKTALDAGDSKIAVEVLKAANIYGNVPAPQGKTEPTSIMLDMSEKQAEEKIRLASNGDPQKETALLMEKLPSLTAEIYKNMLANAEKYADDDAVESGEIALSEDSLNSKFDINAVLRDTFAKEYLTMRKNQSAHTNVRGILKIANHLAKQGNNNTSMQDLIIHLQTTPAPKKSFDDLFKEVTEDDI